MAMLATIIARGHQLVGRSTTDGSTSTIDLMIGLFSLVFFFLLLVIMLMRIRRLRLHYLRERQMLPQYAETKRTVNHRQLTIQTNNGRSSVFILRDGTPMLANPNSPPHSPDNVPEIHITFPDEQDSQGQHKSGRVVVVRIGDNAAVGLEPLHEQLPAYEKESSAQFYSIDIEKIGGLKEKDRPEFA